MKIKSDPDPESSIAKERLSQFVYKVQLSVQL